MKMADKLEADRRQTAEASFMYTQYFPAPIRQHLIPETDKAK